MIGSRRALRSFSVLLLTAGSVALAFSCSSSSQAGLAQNCSLNSDCDSPLVCVFAGCHAQCQTPTDCSAGERCVTGTNGMAPNVCQLPQETTCSGSESPCQG